MEIHTCLRSSINAFNFGEEDYESLREAVPKAKFQNHDSYESLKKSGRQASLLLTWNLKSKDYELFPNLRAVITPAAGNDWVEPDPTGKASIFYGAFHGEIMRESILGAVLFMNQKMNLMVKNYQNRNWDRNIQSHCRLLKNQTILIIGHGKIGKHCSSLFKEIGLNVLAINRSGGNEKEGVFGVEFLSQMLPEADHIILILPRIESDKGFLDEELLLKCKAGAFVYNFGRGNAIRSEALESTLSHLGGVFLDVTDTEPLPKESKLWENEKVMITPHSSCVYMEYKTLFIDEVIKLVSGFHS